MFEGSGKGVGESEDVIIPIEETLSNHALNASRNTVTSRLAESSRIDIFVLFTVIGMPPNGRPRPFEIRVNLLVVWPSCSLHHS